MSLEPVNVFVKEDNIALTPVEGVVVRVYDAAGAVFITQVVTDVTGLAAFILDSGFTYQLRFYKVHFGFAPKLISVLASPATNTFDVSTVCLEPPTVTDLRLCVAYGHFRNPDGSPAANVNLRFITKFKPLLLEGDGVLTPSMDVKTDKDGYVQISLIRFGQYDVTVEGIEDHERCIAIPDQLNVSLPSLLFPVVARITFAPVAPWGLIVGGELVVTPTVFSSDDNQLPNTSDVVWSSSDPSVLAVLPGGDLLTLRGIAPGTANVIATRADPSIVRIPDTPIVGVPAAVTVT